MTLFDDMATLAADALLDATMFGEAATYTPAAGTGDVAIRACFGPERQDEMSAGDGQMRKTVRQILIKRTGSDGVADPRFDDIIARGESQNLEEYQIFDFLEKNDAVAVCLCRRRYRNEATRTGYRPTS